MKIIFVCAYRLRLIINGIVVYLYMVWQVWFDCGDEVLKEIATAIKATLGNQLAARLGGEEFGLVLQAKNFSETSAMLAKFQECLNEQVVTYNNNKIKVTASIGATYEVKGSLDEALIVADEHLYLAKNSGRNKIIWDHIKPSVAA